MCAFLLVGDVCQALNLLPCCSNTCQLKNLARNIIKPSNAFNGRSGEACKCSAADEKGSCSTAAVLQAGCRKRLQPLKWSCESRARELTAAFTTWAVPSPSKPRLLCEEGGKVSLHTQHQFCDALWSYSKFWGSLQTLHLVQTMEDAIWAAENLFCKFRQDSPGKDPF